MPKSKTILFPENSKTPDLYAKDYRKLNGVFPDIFSFNNCYYHVETRTYIGEDNRPKRSFKKVEQVSNFIIKPLFFEEIQEDIRRPKNKLVVRVIPEIGRQVTIEIDPSDITTPDLMTKTFFSRARVYWYGDKTATQSLLKSIISPICTLENDSPCIPVLEKTFITGFDKKTNHYIFEKYAVSPDGIRITPSFESAIELQTASIVLPPQINQTEPDYTITPERIRRMYESITAAWPNNQNAAISIGWLIASFFVNQIKSEIGFFPFLSFYGDTQTGKTRLIRTLNSLQGLYNYEGIPMVKMNTMKGPLREIAKKSGMMSVFLESQGETKYSSFEIDQILTIYNNNPLQLRAVRSNDLRTKEIEFLGTLAFVQNIEPFYTKAQQERVISLQFLESHINEFTSKALENLELLTPSELSGFQFFILQNRSLFETEWKEKFSFIRAQFFIKLRDYRIAENYAIVNTFHSLFLKLIQLSGNIKPNLISYAEKKKGDTSIIKNSIADHFFELLFEAIGRDYSEFNMDFEVQDFFEIERNTDRLFIYMPQALEIIKLSGQQLSAHPVTRLYEALRIHPSFTKEKFSKRFGELRRKRNSWLFKYSLVVGNIGIEEDTEIIDNNDQILDSGVSKVSNEKKELAN
jgi:hypothetical protein